MAFIYETSNFIVEAFEKPHVSREEGGHIKIYPKMKISDRTEMNSKEAIEFIKLTMVVGKAMKTAMVKRKVPVVRINYQEMGNWAYKKGEEPYFHMHVYGRAKNAKKQPYKEAVYLPDRSTGFYDDFVPLNEGDIKEIRKEIELVLKEEKYKDFK